MSDLDFKHMNLLLTGKKAAAKGNRYDVFRQTCGVLTEEEEVQWQQLCR